MAEWLEIEEKEEIELQNKRFVAVSSDELNQLEKSRNEANTVHATGWAVKCLTDYLHNTGLTVDFTTVTKAELNNILSQFYGSVRNSQGQHYAITPGSELV